MAIKFDSEDKSSGRKDTGREDKYSTGTPKQAYKDYRSDYPNDGKQARKIEEEITLKIRKPQFVGPKSVEAKKQELVSHIQNFQETFNNQESKAWKAKFRELTEALG